MLQADTVYYRSNASGFAPYEMPLQMPVVLEPPEPAVPMPRFGMLSTPLTIEEVLATNRLYEDARYRTSGHVQPGYSGTARPANSWW